ncbi:hypothetical protein BC332_34564 [Capsicum chinense]|nr:hypothetical protein BC332_34564 [Capsicum chinense]
MVAWDWLFSRDRGGPKKRWVSPSTIDLKRNIYHIAVNKYDTNIAIIENQGEYISGIDESNVRIYDVGRSKDDADENEVVEDEEEDDLDNSGSGSDDDDDDDQGAGVRLAQRDLPANG